jgi:tRNA threonylcarbamoyladenosine biosynthesis protein TsaE
MNKKTFIVSEKELDQVIDYLFDLMKDIHIFTFIGSLGAGKTTIIRQILKKWGIEGKITSPTFSYLNIYVNNLGEHFYHFDLYRINTMDQFLAAGFDEYLHMPQSWSFIEWPTVILPLLNKEKSCNITIEYAENNAKRIISITW